MDDRYPARMPGPLGSHVAGFRAQMARLGYTPRYCRDHAYVLVHLSRWLEDEGLAPAELTAERVTRFAQARRAAGYRNWVTVRSLRLLLGYLRAAGVIPPGPPGGPGGPVDAVLAGFRRYLSGERRLAARTVDLRASFARQFLMTQVTGGELDLGRLEPAAVIAFASGLVRPLRHRVCEAAGHGAAVAAAVPVRIRRYRAGPVRGGAGGCRVADERASACRGR
jgi:integrase/recombinase XerD